MQLDRNSRARIQQLLADRDVAERIQLVIKDSCNPTPMVPGVFSLCAASLLADDSEPMHLQIPAPMLTGLMAAFLAANSDALHEMGVELPADEPPLELPKNMFEGLADHIQELVASGATGGAFRIGPNGSLVPVPEEEIPAEVRQAFKAKREEEESPGAAAFIKSIGGNKAAG